MKCSIGYDDHWKLEMTSAYIQHNPSLCKNIEVKTELFEYLLNCEIEIRNKLIQNILNKNLWTK
jgi:hypothetical protein